MQITLPRVLWNGGASGGNVILQLREKSKQLTGRLVAIRKRGRNVFEFKSESGSESILIVPQKRKIPDAYIRAVVSQIDNTNQDVDLRDGKWLKHPLLNLGDEGNEEEIQSVLDSWNGSFSFLGENTDLGIGGLRKPQLGALHAIHAHWSVSDAPATIVLPTGVGKTETMLSLLVSTPCPRLLVVVPTDILRSQIAEKFLTLGILKEPNCSVLSSQAKYPIIGILKHIPKSIEETDLFFSRCHVIVTTSSIAGRCDFNIQNRMADLCPYLFIDEAHHVEAPTWRAFKERFQNRKTVQFTATPFRDDGKPLDGKIVFKYPLKKAQQEGFFKKIEFKGVWEFDPGKSDKAIAETAIEQLRKDAAKGHILMARVGSVQRAKEVFEIYKQYSEYNPVEIHTGVKSSRQLKQIRRQILSGASQIVVCVDMLGEGFDLPELKIAAFHDIRKSLAVTLQLAGRFTRTKPELGNATFVANIADVHVKDELKKLYMRDPDWNELLPEFSDEVIDEQLSLQEFLAGFSDYPHEIPLKAVRPALSTVVYKTDCHDWSPNNISAGIPAIRNCNEIYKTINEEKHTIVVITARRNSPDWSTLEDLYSWQWDLYVIFWSNSLNLLFINCSANAGEYKALAEAIAGENVTLVNGQQVFRTFSGVNRLRLKNVGLTEQLGRNIRYTGRMGADIEPGLSEIHRQRAQKSVLAGSGYEGGERVTIGASRKGRIWSHRRDRVDSLVTWCMGIGSKLLDESIDPDEVLKGTLDAQTLDARPQKMPIACDWPEEIYKSQESFWSVIVDGVEHSLFNLDISIIDPSPTDVLKIAISSDTFQILVELQLFEVNQRPDYKFVLLGKESVIFRRGGYEYDLTDFFYTKPPTVWFADGSSLEGNQYVEVKKSITPYYRDRIIAWDWTGVNIRKESQGEDKDQDSIQARVITELKKRDYIMIVDDDGKGEAADIVCISIPGGMGNPASIDVEFYHCKYSHESTPGRRISDLYEVCGQAQKSIAWMSSTEKQIDLFTHLLRREAHRIDRDRVSRYEVGNGEILKTIREMSSELPVQMSIFIVQPGVSKQNASLDQLYLMGVTENYLLETYQLPFSVIASP